MISLSPAIQMDLTFTANNRPAMKNWMVILILALAGGVWGQGGMLLVGGAAAPPPAAQLLLDEYPGAAAAYSLRLLRTAYAGDCVEVRRVSDGATSNIGFSGGVIDTATLKTFCAGTDCFVRTWYDQSTNAYNATQTTTTIQPRIVAGGVIMRQSGLPAIEFTADYLPINNSLGTLLAGEDVTISLFSITRYTSLSSGATIFAAAGSGFTPFWQVYFNTVSFIVRKRSDASVLIANPANSVTTNNTLYTAIDQGTTLISARNGSIVDNGISFDTGFITLTRATIGARVNEQLNVGEIGNAIMQELILYKSNQSSNRTGIETAINSFYNIN